MRLGATKQHMGSWMINEWISLFFRWTKTVTIIELTVQNRYLLTHTGQYSAFGMQNTDYYYRNRSRIRWRVAWWQKTMRTLNIARWAKNIYIYLNKPFWACVNVRVVGELRSKYRWHSLSAVRCVTCDNNNRCRCSYQIGNLFVCLRLCLLIHTNSHEISINWLISIGSHGALVVIGQIVDYT